MADILKPSKPGLPPGIEAPLSIMQQDYSPSYFAALEAIPPSLADVDWKDLPGISRILFLDFDGTTHPEPADAGDSFCRLPLIAEVLREFPAVQIVISSAWRLWSPEESAALGILRENFPEDLRRRVVGVTPNAKNLGNRFSELAAYPRERECRAWLKARRVPCTPWMALDDRAALFHPGCGNLMLVDTDYGFLKRNQDEFRRRLQALHAEP